MSHIHCSVCYSYSHLTYAIQSMSYSHLTYTIQSVSYSHLTDTIQSVTYPFTYSFQSVIVHSHTLFQVWPLQSLTYTVTSVTLSHSHTLFQVWHLQSLTYTVSSVTVMIISFSEWSELTQQWGGAWEWLWGSSSSCGHSHLSSALASTKWSALKPHTCKRDWRDSVGYICICMCLYMYVTVMFKEQWIGEGIGHAWDLLERDGRKEMM